MTTAMTTAKYFVVLALNGNPRVKREGYFACVRTMDAWTENWLAKGYQLYYCQTIPLID